VDLQKSKTPGWLRLSFGVKINFILGLGLAILVAVGSIASRSVESLVEASGYESASLAEIGSLDNVIGALRRTESSARKYVITGDVDDLLRYKAVRSLVNFSASGLDASDGDVTQQRRINQLQRTVTERLLRLDELVQVRRERGIAAATDVVRSARGEEINLRIQILADQFREHELRGLGSRRAETAFNAETTSFLVLWGIAFAMSLLVWTMVIIHRNHVGRQAAEQALKASEAQLRLITDAVPALIAYVDRNDRLQFHNRAFERWFERSVSELRERTLRSLMGGAIYAKAVPHIEMALAGQAVDFEIDLGNVRGSEMHLSVQLVPRRDERRAVIGYYVLATNITALKEVDRLKSEFVTTVSHELRTPLTSIRGSLGLVAAGVTGVLPDKAKELVTIAMQNCERLVRLVNDILDSEKMLSGKMELSMRALDLVALIERSVRENESYAATHGVTVALQTGAPEARVMADTDRLVQVVTNLLSNACKFSNKGGVVEVTVEESAQRVRVSVADRGAGVPKEMQKRLFERFAQLDSSDARRKGGTGLGLSICRAIIERMDGHIGFAERDGGGSVFFFELPALKAVAGHGNGDGGGKKMADES
jgi:PAS domain S-box-containing protein